MMRRALGSQVPLVRHPEWSVAVRRQDATRARPPRSVALFLRRSSVYKRLRGRRASPRRVPAPSLHEQPHTTAFVALSSTGSIRSSRRCESGGVAPELADPVYPVEVGEHEDVEKLGAGSGAERVQALAKPALQFVGCHARRLRGHAAGAEAVSRLRERRSERDQCVERG
jgi:hypothetical protein